MTGEAPVPEARETSPRSGGARAFGHVKFGVDRGVARNIIPRVIALEFGRKVAEGLPEDVMNDPEVKRASIGKDDGEPWTAGAVAEAGAKVA